MSSISTKATIRKLDEAFVHFGYTHAIVTDNAACFLSAEFQTWCEQRGIQHLDGAPYHPETNGAARDLCRPSSNLSRNRICLLPTPCRSFLGTTAGMPLASGSSPSELLNGRQICTKLDIIVPERIHTIARGREELAPTRRLTKDSPCFALSYKAGHNKWRPAVVTALPGHQLFEVHMLPDGPTWRPHIDQLRPRRARCGHGHIVNSKC